MDTRTIFEVGAAAILIAWAAYELCRRIQRQVIEEELACIDATDIQLVTSKWDTKPLTEEEAAEMAVSRWDLN
jgi:hypothetical protein